jgi:hypothetical protein
MKSNARRLSFLLSLAATVSVSPPSRAATLLPAVWHDDRVDPVWQWSVPAPSIPDRRAFLWVPPGCTHVRGIVVAVQNMLEQPLFERVAFRRACAADDLAIVIVCSGHDHVPEDDRDPNHAPRSSLDLFLNPRFPKGEENPKAAFADLQGLLDRFAAESGYAELAQAPLMPVGHSSAGSFVWHLSRGAPDRIFAMLPFKTGIKDDGPSGIPIFNVESEWFDFGKENKDVSTTPGSIRTRLGVRQKNPDELFGFYVDVGAGHCDVSDDSIPAVAMFMAKAVAARIPASSPAGQPVKLNPVDVTRGWLVPVADLGKPGTRAVAYADYKGDPKQALWYLDRELAQAVQGHMATQYAKKPQHMEFVRADGTVPTDGGMFSFGAHFIDDLGTFRMEARFIDHLDKTDLYPPGTHFEHGDGPILYRVNSGAVRQVGLDTFRIVPHAGPIVPQGNPWEPTLVAYTPGDDRFRPTERPAHAYVNVVNKAGTPQTVDFPALPNRPAADASPVPLAATATSGLAVQYFVVSGPVRLRDDGTSLDVLPLPPRTRTPVRVMVSAFQWGRPAGQKVQTAGPIRRTFWLTRPGDTVPATDAEAPAAPPTQ